jgi:hypothetical protein
MPYHFIGQFAWVLSGSDLQDDILNIEINIIIIIKINVLHGVTAEII